MMLTAGVEAAVGNSALVGLPVGTDDESAATGKKPYVRVVMHSLAVRSNTSLPRFSSKRRRSPSLITPTSFSPSTTVVTPSFLRDIS